VIILTKPRVVEMTTNAGQITRNTSAAVQPKNVVTKIPAPNRPTHTAVSLQAPYGLFITGLSIAPHRKLRVPATTMLFLARAIRLTTW
jgi:hypothetical protein